MPESYFQADLEDRKDLLIKAAGETELPASLIEKDIMVVYAIEKLWASPFSHNLQFKGGTMLTKVHGLIKRLSEDIDVLYNAEDFMPERVQDGQLELPPTKSQKEKIEQQARRFLRQWIPDTLAAYLRQELLQDGIEAELEIRLKRPPYQLLIHYDAIRPIPNPLIQPVKLEVWSSSAFQPNPTDTVECYAGRQLNGLQLPYTTQVTSLDITRAYCDKLDAVQRLANTYITPGNGMSWHFLDLAELHRAGLTPQALTNKATVYETIAHTHAFHRTTGLTNEHIEQGKLRLWPQGEQEQNLEIDYQVMCDARMVFGERLTFQQLKSQILEIEAMWNS